MMKSSRTAALACGFLFWARLVSVQAAEAKTTWQAEWDATVEAAKKEGQVAIYHTRGPFEKVFAEFSRRYPEVKTVSVTGRGGELISRIMAERRAEKHGADIYLGATGTPVEVLYPAKVLQPVPSIMILPEVKNPSNWFRKQHHYADPESKYIFVFEGVVRSDMAYNTKLVEPQEIASYWDLLKPKWKGKIAAMDPRLPGFPSGLLQFAYYNPELGAKFLKRLFGEMDVTLARDGRQLVDWLAVGKFAIVLAPSASDLQSGMRQGLPLARFEPRAFKEGIYMRATQGSLSVLGRPPHPNATKLVVNWLLSKEGQTQYQKAFLRIDPVFSLREDVPADPALESYRPQAGEKFMAVYRPKFRDLEPAFKIIEEAMKR
jgi:ABC-type Fe3+ transport system substrate-binding protein